MSMRSAARDDPRSFGPSRRRNLQFAPESAAARKELATLYTNPDELDHVVDTMRLRN